MIDLIVFSSIGFLAVFFIAWMLRPDLRTWIEKPKHRFQANVQSYDQEQKAAASGERPRPEATSR
ncbi:MAG TPA: hypothetical protein VG274_03515 [Rhizomicrobium sp.]|nr:hypothetical protein [Rhizomicrobium sp.]